MKKILVTVIFLAVTGVVIYFAWPYARTLFFGAPVNNQTITVPPLINKNIKVLTSNAIFDFWIKGDAIYYLATDGQIFQIASDGSETNVNDQKIFNLASVSVSTDGSLALVSFGTNNKIFSVFNLATKIWQPLPIDTTAATWSPNQNQLAILKNAGVASSLEIFDPATQKASPVIKLNQQGLDLNWIMSDAIYLTQKPSAGFASSVWSVNVKNKTLQTIVSEEPGLMVKWSDDGKTGLKFSNATRENNLSLINQNNQLLGNLNFMTTLPSKCAFTAGTLWCGVPLTIPSGTLLPDDYLKNKIYFQDRITAFDTASGTVKEIFDGRDPIIDVEKIAKHGDKLIFLNKYDRKIYSLEIKE